MMGRGEGVPQPPSPQTVMDILLSSSIVVGEVVGADWRAPISSDAGTAFRDCVGAANGRVGQRV